MQVLFVRSFPLIDGTLTYSMRLAKKLRQIGHSSFFLFTCAIQKEMEEEVKKSAPIFYSWELGRLQKENKLPYVDAIHAGVNGDCIPVVYDLKQKFFKRAAIVYGAWASNSFIHRSKLGFSPDGLFYRYFLKRLPSQNISFMGPTIKEKHERFLGEQISQGPVIPNALELTNQYQKREGVQRRTIVSIGRLAPSKEYVFATIDVLKNLRVNHIEYTFHIYGSGEYMPELERKVKEEALQDFIYLHGEIPYSLVEQKLRNAGFFIGMGAAIIEAAAMGIPSIQAIEYNAQPHVYGWFHQLFDGEIGEYRKGKKTVSLQQLLSDAYSLTDNEYEEMGLASFTRAQAFSLDNVIMQYLDFLEKADKDFVLPFPKWKRWLLKAARQPFKLLEMRPTETIRK